MKQVTVEGAVRMNGVAIACPTCKVAKGLSFTVSATSDTYSTAGCPNGHQWKESRVHGALVDNLLGSAT